MKITVKRILIPLLSAILLTVLTVLTLPHFIESDQNEIVTVYCVSEARKSGKSSEVVTYTYDEKGRLLKVCEESNGKVRTKEYTYDEQGNCLTYPHPGGGNVDATYDENGNMLTYKLYGSSDRIWHDFIYTYDSCNNLIKKESLNDGVVGAVDAWTYDKSGRMLTHFKEYTHDASTPNTYTYADYDSSGNLISYKTYYNDLLRTHITYTYDSSGRIATSQTIQDGSVEAKSEFIYDSNGRLILTKSHSLGTHIPELKPTSLSYFEYSYKYDQNGNLLEAAKTYEDGFTESQKWTYDDKGNLTSYDPYSTSLTRWTHDRHGNILTEEWIYENEVRMTTEYDYVAFRMTRKDAERIKAQQAEIFQLPTCDVTPKTVLDEG